MRFLNGLLTAGLLATLAAAADGKFTLTGENTKVQWVGAKKEGKHNGGFKKLSGTATVTGTDPATAKIEVTIETDSLYSDNEKLTGHLKSPDFFDVKTNPTAKFVSTKVEALPDHKGVYKVTGELTLNGKKKEISFPARITVEGGALKLDSEFKIGRLDFDLGSKFPPERIYNEVTLKVNVNAK